MKINKYLINLTLRKIQVITYIMISKLFTSYNTIYLLYYYVYGKDDEKITFLIFKY